MSGAKRDDPASDAPGPDIDPEDDATQAVDLPRGLLDAIPDPEARPVAVSIRVERAARPAAPSPIEPEDPGDQTITEVPAEYAPAAYVPPAYTPPRHASDERPVPIPVPGSAERPIPRVIRTPRPAAPAIAEPLTQVEPGPTHVQPARRAPIPSAPPVPLPEVHTASRVPIPVARAIPVPSAPVPALPIPAAPIPAVPRPPPPAAPPPALGPGLIDDDEADEKTNIFVAEPRGPQLPRGRLTVIEGAEPGKTWYLNRARTQMGRGADNDIVLLDINISRGHLRIDRHGQGFRVVDLDSGNGTQLNDRRVTREELFDGDRIRLGEHLLEFNTMDGARPRIRDAAHTDPNIAVGPITTPGRRIGIPRTWIIAWSAATFLAVFGTMYIARTVKARQAAAESLKGAQAALADAEAALADRAWHRGREALIRARAEQPSLTDYAARLSAINAEIRAAKAFRLMRLRLSAGQLTEARLAFGDVPEGSVYRPEAMILERRLAEAERDQQVARARRERDAGRAKVARQIVEKVLADDPLHAEAKAVLGTLPPEVPTPGVDAPASATSSAPASKTPAPAKADGAAPRRRAPRRPKPATKGGGARLAAGDAAYRAGRFADAQAEFAAAAQAAQGDDAKKARQKAAAAGALASALPAAQRADAGNQSGRAVKEFERALKADRTLGGRNAGRIRPPLARHLCREAMKAFMRRQYDRADKLNGRALRLDPNLSQARRLKERIEKMPR